MMDNLEVRGWLRQAIENTADWRRRTAEQYPDDNRNIEAAEELERLAGTVDDIPEALLRRVRRGIGEQVGQLQSLRDRVRNAYAGSASQIRGHRRRSWLSTSVTRSRT